MRTIKTSIAAAMLTIGLAAMAAQPVVYTLTLPALPNGTNGTSLTVTVTNMLLTTPNGSVISNYFDTEFQSQFTLYGSVTTVSNAGYGGTALGTYTFNTLVSPDATTWMTGTPFVLTSTGTGYTNTIATVASNYTATTFRYWTITNVTVTPTNCTGTPKLTIFFKTP